MANEEKVNEKPLKNWLMALLLCWFLGFLGVHRLYAGKIKTGFLMAAGTIASVCVMFYNIYLGLACLVLVGAFVVNDFAIIIIKRFKDCYGREIEHDLV